MMGLTLPRFLVAQVGRDGSRVIHRTMRVYDSWQVVVEADLANIHLGMRANVRVWKVFPYKREPQEISQKQYVELGLRR